MGGGEMIKEHSTISEEYMHPTYMVTHGYPNPAYMATHGYPNPAYTHGYPWLPLSSIMWLPLCSSLATIRYSQLLQRSEPPVFTMMCTCRLQCSCTSTNMHSNILDVGLAVDAVRVVLKVVAE